jgi:LysR family nitrogen assimilation transcriptional regulator
VAKIEDEEVDIRQLNTFIAVLEEGSLTKAADRLHTVQPALTQQIKALEAELEVSLFVRHARGVSPTEAGRRLADRARSLIAQLDECRAYVRESEVQPAGEVRIGISTTASALLTPKLIPAVASAYPHVRLHIVEPMSGMRIHWLEEARLDFAIIYSGSYSQGMHSETLLTEALDLCGPQSSPLLRSGSGELPLRFQEAMELPLIVPHRGYGIRDQLDALARQTSCSLRIAFEIDSTSVIKSLVEQGFGYAFLPAMATFEERAKGKLLSRRVVSPVVERSLYAVSFPERPLGSAQLRVKELCVQTLYNLVDSGLWEARRETVRSKTSDGSEPQS